MCGRFTQKSERPDIQLEFYIQGWNAEPAVSYNIAPSQKAGVIFRDDGKNVYDEFEWGLIPHWAKERKSSYSMINARAETVHQKPAYKYSFRHRRCLIPASGYYEWKHAGKIKIPFYIFLKQEPLFSFAGLYDEWGQDEREKARTFTIITTEANELIAGIHDKKRMPVIIPRKDRDSWLDVDAPDYNEKNLLGLLKPFETKMMDAYEVSTLVNSPANNSPACIEPLTQ